MAIWIEMLAGSWLVIWRGRRTPSGCGWRYRVDPSSSGADDLCASSPPSPSCHVTLPAYSFSLTSAAGSLYLHGGPWRHRRMIVRASGINKCEPPNEWACVNSHKTIKFQYFPNPPRLQLSCPMTCPFCTR